MKSIILVMTSHDKMGNTGKRTGAYLSEIAHPHLVFQRAGYSVELASVRGRAVPLDGVDQADAVSRKFLERYEQQLSATPRVRDLSPDGKSAVFFAGGHGCMWDFPHDQDLARLTAQIYERGGVVGAVCHGPAALVNIRLSSGQYLVSGKAVSAFTNEEERAVGLEKVVPFLLADKLEERGATHVGAPNWEERVVVSERLVTGQNPASATAVAEEVLRVIHSTQKESAA